MARLPPYHAAFLASVLLLLLPEARGDCGRPERIENTELREQLNDSYPIGTKLTFNCIPGYEPPPGPRPFITCLPTSEWSQISAVCRRRRCPVPHIENGRIAGESELLFGDRITFVCDEGFRIIGQNGARCVVHEKRVVWDTDPPHCERIPCFPPPQISNGRHDGMDNYVYGSTVTYRCDAGYSLIGKETIVCTFDQSQNGMWSGPAPECKVVSCRTPDIPNGVLVTAYRPSYTYQDRVVFRCNPGFKLKGNRGDTTCEADSRWHRLPECIADTSTGEGGDGTSEDGGIPGGSTVQSSLGSTVKPSEETTETEIEYTESPELPTEESAYTESPELPTEESGSSISVPVAVGTSVAVIAVVGIIAAALIYRALRKRQGKTATGSASESYAAVPRNTDISLKENV